MNKHEEEICVNAVKFAVLMERTKWKECIERISKEISQRTQDIKKYDFGGAYTDGKLAAHEYDLHVIHKYIKEIKE